MRRCGGGRHGGNGTGGCNRLTGRIVVHRLIGRRDGGNGDAASALQDHHGGEHLAQFGDRGGGIGRQVDGFHMGRLFRMQIAVRRAREADIGREKEMPLPGGLVGGGRLGQEAHAAQGDALPRPMVVRTISLVMIVEGSRRKIRSGDTHGTCTQEGEIHPPIDRK